ncbi:Argininosuccinate synthase [Metarhizium anisopliae BRIP 53293]|uniref:Argininosuccinate synthase n=1 Tax=Metarhizium anisopliae BRIP 53293 TaxID=1291518 RepID=A0A0D9NIQ7_METAN|nr:Argininosuccinate synthase [Metarhizium anisopliae BRIP 53293]KJK90532.1 Argininosuccinate synthase [Metarhizium anisopliae BRIP 53284]
MSKGRVCLAYSGGLDTSTILVWLLQQGYQVVCYLGDVGQDEDFAAVEAKALKLGAEAFVCENLQRELVDDVVSRAIMCNAIFEDQYLLGTALARPIIARSMIRVAEKHNCAYLSHGATGKGVRFELAFIALNPSIQILAPWRMPEFIEKFQGRNDLLKFAAENNIPVSSTPKAPWSMDENIIHTSYEAGILEDPDHTPPKELWMRTKDPQDAPNEPTEFSVHFEKGLISKVVVGDKEVTDSIGYENGVGRVDIVENRFIGLKSRGCYDTPGLTLARLAHLSLEGLVMDGRVRELRDQFSSITWSRLIYNGMYFSPEREFVENSVVFCQHNVTGVVRLSAYKGHAYVLGRSSNASNLYSEQDASMDSLEGFSPMDTTGFIAIQAIRLKKYGEQKIKDGQPLSKS